MEDLSAKCNAYAILMVCDLVLVAFIIVLCWKARRGYLRESGPPNWDPAIAPSTAPKDIGNDPDGEKQDHSLCLCLPRHTTRMSLWEHVSNMSISDTDTKDHVDKVLKRSKAYDVVNYTPSNDLCGCIYYMYPSIKCGPSCSIIGSCCCCRTDFSLALHLALKNKKIQTAAALLDAGADIYCKEPNSGADPYNQTFLHVLASEGNLDIFQDIARKIVDTSHPLNKQEYVFIISDEFSIPISREPATQQSEASKKYTPLKQLLPEKKAGPRIARIEHTSFEDPGGAGKKWVMFQDDYGWYPYDALERTFWLDFKNGAGKTPEEVARSYGHSELANFMKFEKSSALTDDVVRDATLARALVWPDDGDGNHPLPGALSQHRETYGVGILKLASNRICRNFARLSTNESEMQRIRRNIYTEGQQHLNYGSDVLAVKLRPIKQFLIDYVQIPLWFGDCAAGGPPPAFTEVVFLPIVEIVRENIAALVQDVKENPRYYINKVRDKALPDSQVYEGQRLKGLWDNGQSQFNAMCYWVDMQKAKSRGSVCVQPTNCPLKLTMLLSTETPFFEVIVKKVASDLGMDVAKSVTFRQLSKGLYRIIEKCLLKSKAENTLTGPIDCSKVKDACGCVISCNGFGEMLIVMQRIYDEKLWDVCELKDTWNGLSKAGWRDYKVIVKYNKLLFEIQVVLEKMFDGRKFLHGHIAYTEFRNFYECIKYAVCPPTRDDEDVGGWQKELDEAVNPPSVVRVEKGAEMVSAVKQQQPDSTADEIASLQAQIKELEMRQVVSVPALAVARTQSA